MATLIKSCKKCNKTMTLKSGKFGQFWACTGFPYCKSTEKYVKSTVKTESVKVSSFQDTANQTNIFNFLKDTVKNLLIEAGAGCGKTSTIVKSLQYIDEKNQVIFLAFNKKIVTEIESRINQVNVQISTIHSLCLKNIKSVNKYVKVDAKKYATLILQCGLIDEDSRKQYIKPVKSVISLLQANLLVCNFENVKSIFENYNIEGIELNDFTFQIIESIYTTGLNLNSSIIDFDDMVFECAINSHFCKKYDVIFIDECQDLSKLNLQIIKSTLSESGRVIFVGDSNQSIYAFRGADSESINQIKSFFKVESLPLNESFRIPQNIMTVINNEFPEIVLTSKKSGGRVDSISESSLLVEITKLKKSMVICAHNAPLVKPCFELIRAGYSAKIEGRDIAQDLINLIIKINKKYECTNLNKLSESLDAHFNELSVKYANAKNKDFLNVIADQIETIKVFCEVAESVEDILVKIDNLFDDNSGADFIFSSIHKAKGLENQNVVILKPSLIGKKAKTESDILQAKNLKYVAYTRSLDTLIFCE